MHITPRNRSAGEATTWSASAMALWPNLSSNALRPNGLGSTDGCGLPVAPLLAPALEQYDELLRAGSGNRADGGDLEWVAGLKQARGRGGGLWRV